MSFFVNFFIFVSLFFGNLQISEKHKNPETNSSSQILSAELPVEELRLRFKEEKIDLDILKSTPRDSNILAKKQNKTQNFSNEKEKRIHDFGNPKSFDFSKWNSANYAGIGLWTDVIDRNYFIIHSHLNPKAKNLTINEKIIIGGKKYKVVAKYEKNNATNEAYNFVFKDHFFANQLQTCKDDKIVIIYDLEMM
ncbi:MAG: hypothetical protein Fur0024_3150 [Patescibacteria group bacterium]